MFRCSKWGTERNVMFEKLADLQATPSGADTDEKKMGTLLTNTSLAVLEAVGDYLKTTFQERRKLAA